MTRKLPTIIATLLTFAALAGCSKHKCDFDSAAEKEAFATLADMTEGGFSCDVEGASEVAGFVEPNSRCEIGSAKCVPTMHAIHPGPSTVKDVAAKYRAFLEKNQWKVEEKPISGNYQNGKPFQGVQMYAKKGDKDMGVKVVPFGDDMVETDTVLAAIK
jgi:hypothetical protein